MGWDAREFLRPQSRLSGHLFWTWNSDLKLYNWAKWFPHIPTAGNWDVYVFVASRYFGTTRATYDIYHNGVRDRRTINQARYYDQWVAWHLLFLRCSGEYVFMWVTLLGLGLWGQRFFRQQKGKSISP